MIEPTNEIAPAISTYEEIVKIIPHMVKIISAFESFTPQASQPIKAQTQKALGMDADDEDYYD
jgi:hypothetical protein